MDDPMAAIRQTFFQECEEQLAELESGLIAMEDGTASSETVNAVFRAVHSIKGGAGIFALDALVRFAHVFETALDKVRSGEMAATHPVVAVFLRAADVLADLVRAARDDSKVDDARTAAMVAEFASIDGGAAPEPAPVPVATPEAEGPVWTIIFTPAPALYAKANETAIILRELKRLGEMQVELDAGNLPELSELDPDGAYLTWRIKLTTDADEMSIRHVFEFVDEDCHLEIIPPAEAEEQAGFAPGTVITGDNGFKFEFFPPVMDEEPEEAPPPPPPVVAKKVEPPEPAPKAPAVEAMAAKAESGAAVSATIRVDLDRVDRMIDLVGELVINEAMLSQRVLEAGINRASGVAMALEELEHLTREIQDSVMAIRAQPVRSVFQRMPRLVREVAAMTGKQVKLVMDGEGGRQDRHRAHCRPAHPYAAQRHRPRAGKPREARGRGQVRRGHGEADGAAPLRAHCAGSGR